MSQWVNENKMKLNAKKTKLLLEGRSGWTEEQEDVSVTLNGEQLPRSWMVKCLGVSIDDGLTWRESMLTHAEEVLLWIDQTAEAEGCDQKQRND